MTLAALAVVLWLAVGFVAFIVAVAVDFESSREILANVVLWLIVMIVWPLLLFWVAVELRERRLAREGRAE